MSTTTTAVIDRPAVAFVPTQAGAPGLGRVAGSSAGTTLRARGVDPALLAPTSPSTRVLRAGRLQCLAVAHLLAQPDADLSAVARVVETDPVLTLRTLHLASTLTGSGVDTVEQALALLGGRRTAALVAELLVTARSEPRPRLWTVLTRALTVEALSGEAAGYTVGLLTAMADELGVPADVVLHTAGLSAEVRDRNGRLGQALTAVTAHERSDRIGVLRAGFAPVDVYDAYLRAFTDAMATAQAVDPA